MEIDGPPAGKHRSEDDDDRDGRAHEEERSLVQARTHFASDTRGCRRAADHVQRATRSSAADADFAFCAFQRPFRARAREFLIFECLRPRSGLRSVPSRIAFQPDSVPAPVSGTDFRLNHPRSLSAGSGQRSKQRLNRRGDTLFVDPSSVEMP